MKITKEQVLHVASLSNLSFSEEETERLASEMSGMIAFADKLKGLNVDGVPPTTHAVPIQNVFREDGVLPSFERSVLINIAPRHDETSVLVPRVVD
ncbi:MAG: Asp-tRNA(Asn)/Glu-tRNA(Gln) amidotransferase subunit GatC [Christensenellales bacterium]|jgi:aspartyl-tRNA(Asn)/glutamyl-tRNA(Gln) amidotransferase subunit C